MQCSSCPPPLPLLQPLLLLLLLVLLTPPLLAADCPVLGTASAPDVQTKALLAPSVFQGTLTAAPERRGPSARATFRVDRALKGRRPPDAVVVEFAVRSHPERCRGAILEEGGALVAGRRYVVFAAPWRKRWIAVAQPEDYSKRKAVSRVLCDQCAKAPSIRNLKDTTLEEHSKLKLKCRISGNPPPRVSWFKNGHGIKSNSRIKIKSKRKYSHLIINRVAAEDAGEYTCRAINVLGNATATATVLVKSESTTDSTLWPFRKGPCPRKNFCLNGGTCSYYEIVREYVCECAEGYRGQRCESKAISTLSNPPEGSPRIEKGNSLAAG